MKDERDLERFLSQVMVPSLREGPHRARLKSELLNSTERVPLARSVLSLRTGLPMSRLMRLAASLLIAGFLVMSGWAAEKVFEQISKKYYVELEKHDLSPVKFPTGSGDARTGASMTIVGTTVPEDGAPESEEKAIERFAIMKRMLAEKKYKFLKELELPPGSPTQYSYRFTFPNGEHVNMNFSMRIENVASWDEYVSKSKDRTQQRNQKISKAIAVGRFRLLDVEPLTTHVCREVRSGHKLLALRVDLPEGKKLASISSESGTIKPYQTSWQDHLRSVQRGDRILLELLVIENYTYEITLEDGTTTIFTYGGSEPLKSPG